MNNSYNLLQKLIDTNKSGIVTFTLPKADGSGFLEPISGYLIGDISIKLANKFQAVLPNIDAVTLASQIVSDDQNALAWIGSTQSAWMGSEPLRLTIPFYLFSTNAKSKITDKVNSFRQLLVPYKEEGSEFKIKLHGGYAPDIFDGFEWQGQKAINSDIAGTIDKGNLLHGTQGLVTVRVGNQFTLSKMLIEDLVTENSQVQVADGNPLYIKVSATFKSYRVLFSDEILKMFQPG